QEYLARHEADAFRLMVLNSHYRSPLTFTEEVTAQAEAALERLRSALRPARRDGAGESAASTLPAEAEAARARFIEAMEDDFNTPAALASLFDLVRSINQARDAGCEEASLGAGQAVLRELAGVLGLRLDRRQVEAGDSAALVQLLVEVREELRREQQWALADRIRHRLAEAGVVLEDGPGGTHWERR
ncbi:MAG TPA: DALR domain-containing protein, partial [Anaerolineales bacterium]|nr:DALR domain-containing protein [Anaerolineales bacterium]